MNTTSTRTTGLSIQVDGKTIPLADAVWYAQASCGCRYAVTLAEIDGHVICATLEDARRELLGPSKAQIQRAEQEGTQVVLAARRPLTLDKCEHTPRLGRADVTAPNGHEWATTDPARGRQTHVRHVIPTLPDGDDAWSVREATVAVCGKRPGRSTWWRTDRDSVVLRVKSDKMPCLACVSKVNDLNGDA